MSGKSAELLFQTRLLQTLEDLARHGDFRSRKDLIDFLEFKSRDALRRFREEPSKEREYELMGTVHLYVECLKLGKK